MFQEDVSQLRHNPTQLLRTWFRWDFSFFSCLSSQLIWVASMAGKGSGKLLQSSSNTWEPAGNQHSPSKEAPLTFYLFTAMPREGILEKGRHVWKQLLLSSILRPLRRGIHPPIQRENRAILTLQPTPPCMVLCRSCCHGFHQFGRQMQALTVGTSRSTVTGQAGRNSVWVVGM